MPVQTVCFDLGGVMLQIHHSFAEAAAAAGIPQIPPVQNLHHYPPIVAYQAGKLPEADFLQALAQDLDVSVTQAKATFAAILRADYPGAQKLVRDLQSAGYQVVCLSNTNDLHYQEFFTGRFPVCQAFDHLLASHIIQASKPHPEAYQAIEDVTGSRPQEIVFFDDHPANVEAAAQRGWIAHIVDPDDDPPAYARRILQGLGVLACP